MYHRMTLFAKIIINIITLANNSPFKSSLYNLYKNALCRIRHVNLNTYIYCRKCASIFSLLLSPYKASAKVLEDLSQGGPPSIGTFSKRFELCEMCDNTCCNLPLELSMLIKKALQHSCIFSE